MSLSVRLWRREKIVKQTLLNIYVLVKKLNERASKKVKMQKTHIFSTYGKVYPNWI